AQARDTVTGTYAAQTKPRAYLFGVGAVSTVIATLVVGLPPSNNARILALSGAAVFTAAALVIRPIQQWACNRSASESQRTHMGAFRRSSTGVETCNERLALQYHATIRFLDAIP